MNNIEQWKTKDDILPIELDGQDDDGAGNGMRKSQLQWLNFVTMASGPLETMEWQWFFSNLFYFYLDIHNQGYSTIVNYNCDSYLTISLHVWQQYHGCINHRLNNRNS